MTGGTWVSLAVALLLLPALMAGIDAIGAARARDNLRRGRHRRDETRPADELVEDFEVLVPIYGAIRYLENIDYLRPYGSRVLLCTTSGESSQFDAELEAVAGANGFRIFRGDVTRSAGTSERATGGTVRDLLIRDALAEVRASYVVCVDADTTTTRPLGELVATMVARGLDLASIRLVPSNDGTWLARLQGHEYRIVMSLRRVMPWLVSGACHGVRTEAHREIMSRHSLFFQGNDVELGVLAGALGYKVGHVAFEVPTTVPDRLRPWLRQRLAWAGGEWRLFLMNPQIAVRHPFFWFYGAVIAILASPLRWESLLHPGVSLAAVAVAYWVLMAYLHREHRDKYLLWLPFYAAFSSLILMPLGLIWYARMAWTGRNLGLIRLSRGSELRQEWARQEGVIPLDDHLWQVRLGDTSNVRVA